eukprot:9789919-Alexandrium_andersonii.AAC.1
MLTHASPRSAASREAGRPGGAPPPPSPRAATNCAAPEPLGAPAAGVPAAPGAEGGFPAPGRSPTEARDSGG